MPDTPHDHGVTASPGVPPSSRGKDVVSETRGGSVRLAMLDVGSNTMHLLVVDAEPGACPIPAADRRWESPLLERLTPQHEVTEEGREALRAIVEEAHAYASELGVADFSAFATSALREAGNADDVIDHVRASTGVDLVVLDGEDEARLTFLAARRWFGWASGRLLVLDIGGGPPGIAPRAAGEPPPGRARA